MANRKQVSEISIKQDDYMDNEPTYMPGARRLFSWFIHGGKMQIHVVDADIKQTPFDMLVIPVNMDLVGQHTTELGAKCSNGYIKRFKTVNVVFGDVVWCVSSKDFASKRVSLAVLFDTTAVRSQLNVCVDKIVKDIFREAEQSKYNMIGIQAIADDVFVAFVREFIKNRKDHFTGKMFMFLCMEKDNPRLSKFVNDIDSLTRATKLPRRLSSRDMRGQFPCLKIRTRIDRNSLLECECESIVAAVGSDLKLNVGVITSELAKAAGNESQNYLDKLEHPAKYWDVISCDAGNLRQEGVKFLFFGCIQRWEKKEKMQELLSKFIFGCLLKAEESGCTSIAIPLLGTGRLGYPEHIVLISILDGIELFAQLGTLGRLKDVLIASPSIDDDTYCKFVREIQRRGNKNTKPLFKQTDAAVLRSTDTCNKYSLTVVKEEHLQEQLPVEFVELVLNHRPAESAIYPPSMNSGKLRIDCQISEGTLPRVIKQASKKCETEKITALVVYTSNLPKISAVLLVNKIRDNFEKDLNMIYLHKVMIVVSSDEDFTECQRNLINLRTVNGEPKWNEDRCHFDDEVYITDVNQSLESADIMDTLDKDSGLVLDLVTAEVNPGISKYLKTILKKDMWKEKMKSSFNVKVYERNGMMKLEGTLHDILKAESYLETKFPTFPDVQSSPDNQVSLLPVNDGESKTRKLIKEGTSNEQIEVMKDPLNVFHKVQNKDDSEKTVPRNSNDKATETTRHIPKNPHSSENEINTQAKPNINEKTQTPDFRDAKPVTNTSVPFQFNKISVYVYSSDITTAPTATIVCPDDWNFTHSSGLSEYILNKAGVDGRNSWNQLIPNEPVSCFVTHAGKLQYQNIIHVVRPVKKENIHQVILNILHESNRLSIASVAIPTIGAGNWKDDVKGCAEQYFKAIQEFSDTVDVSRTTVKDIHIVDKTKKTIDTVRSIFQRNFAAVSEERSVVLADDLSHAIFSNTVAVTNQCMFSFQTDIKVFFTNCHFTEPIGCTKKALLNCPNLNTYFKNHTGEKYEVARVCSISGTESLFCRTAIVAIRPWPPISNFNKNKNDVFKSDIRRTMKNIMEKVQQLHGSTVAIPLITSSDKSDVIGLCCSAMAEELIQCAHSSFKLKVYVVTDNEATCERFHSVLGNLLK